MVGRALFALAGGLMCGIVPSTTRVPVVAGTIEGTVRDPGGGALGGARVLLQATGAVAVSGADGRYRLEHVTPGTHRLVARLIGFRGSAVTVEVREGRVTTAADIVLQPVVLQLKEQVATRDESAAPHEIRVTGALRASAAAPPLNTEEYKHIAENGWRSPRQHPLSTFSADVDAGSYSNVRRFISEGRLPPADAVRIEELINYFRYEYPAPRGEHPFSVTTELADAPWRTGHRLALIGLATRPLAVDELPPSNLVFLLDVSGSMNMPAKLPLVKQAFRLLVNELRPVDRVAIVVYAGAAGLVLPSTRGDQKDRILDAIERLQAGGSTAGGAGLELAYRVAREHLIEEGTNRVILATDGDFNVGPSSEGELIRLVERRRQDGVYLTVLGFGTGNLKDARMEQLADKGNGHYAYVDDLLEAKKVLVHELGATLHTVAQDVKLQVEFNPARVAAYRLIGYENRLLADEDFNDDRKDAGDLGAGHAVTALYEIIPVGVESDVAVGTVDPLKYQDRLRGGGITRDWYTIKIRYKAPGASTSRLLERVVRSETEEPSADLRFAAAVAGLGMLLRDSEHKGTLTWERVLSLARGARGPDREGYRAEFIRLVDTARLLARGDE